MAVSNVDYPDAKVIDCSTGNVVHRLYDSFAAGSQPLSVSFTHQFILYTTFVCHKTGQKLEY